MSRDRPSNLVCRRAPIVAAAAFILVIALGAASAGAAGLKSIDGGHILESVACPLTTQCIGVDHDGREVTFYPQTGTDKGVNPVDSGQLLSSVACPKPNQCTAIQETEDEVTFNPRTGVVNPAGLTTIDSGRYLSSLACPSAAQCTAADQNGAEVTFDPQTGAVNLEGLTPLDNGQSLDGLACLSEKRCVAVDSDGREVTFDPQTGLAKGVNPVDSGQDLLAVACPAANQCTTVPNSGNEVTFDPQTGAVNGPGVKTVDPHHFENSVACPSVTQCTSVDLSGYEATFDPRSGIVNSNGVFPLERGQALTQVACPWVRQCTAVDTSGNEVTFDPQPPGAPSISISRPAQHASFTRGEVIDAHYSCTVPGYPGDITSCSGPVASGRPISTAPGKHSFTVSASEKDGKHSTLTHDYIVYAANGSGTMNVSPKSVPRSSAHHTLTFTYEAARGGLWHGTITLTVPDGWSAPSTSPTAAGGVKATSGARVAVSGRTITVSIPILATAHTLTITYGSRAGGGPGASAPATTGTQIWPVQERSIPQGKLTGLTSPPHTTTT